MHFDIVMITGTLHQQPDWLAIAGNFHQHHEAGSHHKRRVKMIDALCLRHLRPSFIL